MEESLVFINLINFYIQRIAERLGLFETTAIFKKSVGQGPYSACKINESGFNYQDGPTAKIVGTGGRDRLDDTASLVKKLYEECASIIGEAAAGHDLELAVDDLRRRMDGNVPARLLRALPLGVLESEKSKLLSREELETLVKQRTHNLQAAKNDLEKVVEIRTSLLKAESNKLRSVVNSISDGIIVTNRQKRIVFLNGVASRLLGFSEKESLGKPITDLLKLSSEEIPIKVSSFCPIVKVMKDQVLFSQKGLRAQVGPKNIYLDVDSSAIAQGKKADIGCIITLHDVGREKELEIMKLDFVYLAAHELRTPLTSLRGYLEVFTEENKSKFNKEQAFFLERILISSQQLSALVDNLLDASRIERGTLTVHFVSLDWKNLVIQTVDGLAETALKKGVELKFLSGKKRYPPLTADRIRVGEVLGNLLTNALNFTPRGGKITVSIEKEREGLVTKVQDNGRGMPAEALKNLFTKFFRVQNSLEETHQGLGLGLYLSKAIIDLHRGRIWADSKLGEGSTFNFFLPFSQPSTGEEELGIRI